MVKVQNKQVRQFIRAHKPEGWTLVQKGAHFAPRTPDGRSLILPSTPSDFRWQKNTLRDMRRLIREGKRGKSK